MELAKFKHSWSIFSRTKSLTNKFHSFVSTRLPVGWSRVYRLVYMFRIVVKSATTRNSWVISGLLQISRRLTSCALIQILERSIDYRSRSFAINRLKELLPHLARFSLSLSLSLSLSHSHLYRLLGLFEIIWFVLDISPPTVCRTNKGHLREI